MGENEVKSQDRLSDDVIAGFVFDQVLSTDGVHGMGLRKSAAAITKSILSQGKKTRGVRLIYEEEQGYTIEIYIIADFGSNIPETAWNVQKKVHDRLALEFGIEPRSINIHVQGVQAE